MVNRIWWLVVFCLTLALGARADDFVSSSLKVSDPVLVPAGFGSSADYQLFGNLGQLSIGTSTSATFGVNAGFLHYPFVATPAVSATAGDGQVNLSWSAVTGYQGWTVTGYTVGQGTTAGGPYSYTGLGNVTSAARSGLTNGTSYYFVIRVQDVFGNFIATSTEVSATPTVAGGGGGGGGGSGGSGGTASAATGVIFEGRAYPLSRVTVLKDGQIAITTIAGPDSNFQISLTGLAAGNYNFALYGEDQSGRRSSLFTFPVAITAGAVTRVSGIFITPTIAVDKSEVKQGDNLAIFGQTVPASRVTISVNSPVELFFNAPADKNGVYLYNLDTTSLELGAHAAKAKAATSTEISVFGQAVGFQVGDKNVVTPTTGQCPARADLNEDCRINLVDFSIAAFWYQRNLDLNFASREKKWLNADGRVDLIDFSIMAFYWTG